MKCKHYTNNILYFTTKCCDTFFNCKRCHNEAYEFNFNEDYDHQFEINEIMCKECFEFQPFCGVCIFCNQIFAKYVCEECYILEDADRDIFHCDDCGICRVGKEEDFFHCKKCDCCLKNEMKNNHTCVSDRLKQDCVLCLSDLNTSTDAVIFTRCNHNLHGKCFMQIFENGQYRCPYCLKSLVDAKEVFSGLDKIIEENPYPEQQITKILCNDCLTKAEVWFHPVGQKCPECSSYNTSQI